MTQRHWDELFASLVATTFLGLFAKILFLGLWFYWGWFFTYSFGILVIIKNKKTSNRGFEVLYFAIIDLFVKMIYNLCQMNGLTSLE